MTSNSKAHGTGVVEYLVGQRPDRQSQGQTAHRQLEVDLSIPGYRRNLVVDQPLKDVQAFGQCGLAKGRGERRL